LFQDYFLRVNHEIKNKIFTNQGGHPNFHAFYHLRHCPGRRILPDIFQPCKETAQQAVSEATAPREQGHGRVNL
jgi:hypothetical protein